MCACSRPTQSRLTCIAPPTVPRPRENTYASIWWMLLLGSIFCNKNRVEKQPRCSSLAGHHFVRWIKFHALRSWTARRMIGVKGSCETRGANRFVIDHRDSQWRLICGTVSNNFDGWHFYPDRIFARNFQFLRFGWIFRLIARDSQREKKKNFCTDQVAIHSRRINSKFCNDINRISCICNRCTRSPDSFTPYLFIFIAPLNAPLHALRMHWNLCAANMCQS